MGLYLQEPIQKRIKIPGEQKTLSAQRRKPAVSQEGGKRIEEWKEYIREFKATASYARRTGIQGERINEENREMKEDIK